MFWKKKNTSIDISVSNSDSRREAFRFTPFDGELFHVVFLGKKLRILDISAGGVSFENKGFKVNDADIIEIDLREFGRLNQRKISLKTRILSIDAKNICHTEFDGISVEQEDLLHHFVYSLQKKEIRNYKSDE